MSESSTESTPSVTSPTASVPPDADVAGAGVAAMSIPPDLESSLRGIDSLGFVMDVPVELTVVIGRRSMRIGEVLRLGPGSILELSKSNGEPLDIFVNDRLIARGEAVVVAERYGVRITEVLAVDEGPSRGSP